METPTGSIDEMVRDCLAVRIRLIGRAVTSIYDRAVEGHGVSIAQVNLLAAVGKVGPCSPTKLGEVLQLERSTVSRNLDRLFENGWVRAVSSDAKGIREVTLTQAGREKLDSLMVDWRAAQEKAARLLGDAGVRAVREVADGLMGGAGG